MKQKTSIAPVAKVTAPEGLPHINVMVSEIMKIADVGEMTKSAWVKENFIPGLIRKAILADQAGLQGLLGSMRIGPNPDTQITSDLAKDIINLATEYLKEQKTKKITPVSVANEAIMPVLQDRSIVKKVEKKEEKKNKDIGVTLGELDTNGVFDKAKKQIQKSNPQTKEKIRLPKEEYNQLKKDLAKERENYNLVREYHDRAKQEKKEPLRKSIARQLSAIEKKIADMRKKMRGE